MREEPFSAGRFRSAREFTPLLPRGFDFRSKGGRGVTGFTIIELLVVAVIIAMIASAMFTYLQSARSRSRDARREQDIKQIKTALDLYATTYRRFPDCGGSAVVIGSSSDACLSSALIGAGAISGLPTDPLGRANGDITGCSANPAQFTYCYTSFEGGRSYRLNYQLETDTIPGKSKGWQSS